MRLFLKKGGIPRTTIKARWKQAGRMMRNRMKDEVIYSVEMKAPAGGFANC
jgi:hypothetical protein